MLPAAAAEEEDDVTGLRNVEEAEEAEDDGEVAAAVVLPALPVDEDKVEAELIAEGALAAAAAVAADRIWSTRSTWAGAGPKCRPEQ